MKKRITLFSGLTISFALIVTGCSCHKKNNENTSVHEHSWNETTYEWSIDNLSCTAKRVCSSDDTHIETETVTTSYSIITQPQCESEGLGRYIASFENKAFESKSKDVTIEASNHNYQFDSFVWEGYLAKAKYVCSHDNSHIQYHDAEITSEITVEAKCEETGTKVYTASYDGHKDSKIETLPSLGHNLVNHDGKSVTCTEDGYATYVTCSRCDYSTYHTVNATGHNWGAPTYSWADDYSKCTATRVCLNDSTHKEEETENSTYAIVSNPKCENEGLGRYTVSFNNNGFLTQTHDVTLETEGHDYQFDSFVWEGYTAKAKYVCLHDSSHIQYHDAEVTSNVTTSPSCESSGIKTYTATYDGHSDIKNEVLSSLGHSWGTPTYIWSDDYSSCTATRICLRDSTHKQIETVDSTYNVVSNASCENDGLGRYTAIFENTAFSSQTHDVTIESFGHDYQFDSFVWSDYSAQAKYVCSNDNSHVQYHDAIVTSEITSEPKCEETGTKVYTASYDGHSDTKSETLPSLGHDLVSHNGNSATCSEDGYAPYNTCTRCDYSTYQTINATGHNWGNPTYSWSDDNSTCTATRVCLNDSTHIQTETVTSAYSIITPMECETDGLGRYTATFVNDAFEAQTKDVVIPTTINHDWNLTTYTWSDDNSTCTATRVCNNDSTHIQTETVETSYEIITLATEESEGLGRYTATFVNDAFETQTKDVDIEKIYNGRHPVFSEDGTTVMYGLYPQTNVNDPSLISNLDSITEPESNGWYLYNNEYYAKTNAKLYYAANGYKFDNGTTIVKEETYWFKCEPITWKIIDDYNNGVYKLLSTILLDAHCYYGAQTSRTLSGKTVYPNNYKYSDIRAWLNGYDGSQYNVPNYTGKGFINTAFSLNDTYICSSTVKNDSSTTSSTRDNPYACENTQDNIYLFSFVDYSTQGNGFAYQTSASDTRTCRTTDWVRANGGYYTTSGDNQYNGYYWTRSPRHNYTTNASTISPTGVLGTGNGRVDYTYTCVRPAVAIRVTQ